MEARAKVATTRCARVPTDSRVPGVSTVSIENRVNPNDHTHSVYSPCWMKNDPLDYKYITHDFLSSVHISFLSQNCDTKRKPEKPRSREAFLVLLFFSPLRAQHIHLGMSRLVTLLPLKKARRSWSLLKLQWFQAWRDFWLLFPPRTPPLPVKMSPPQGKCHPPPMMCHLPHLSTPPPLMCRPLCHPTCQPHRCYWMLPLLTCHPHPLQGGSPHGQISSFLLGPLNGGWAEVHNFQVGIGSGVAKMSHTAVLIRLSSWTGEMTCPT